MIDDATRFGLTPERIAALFDVPVELVTARPTALPRWQPSGDVLETLRRVVARTRDGQPPQPCVHVLHPRELARARRGEPVATYCAACLAPVVLNAPEPPPAP